MLNRKQFLTKINSALVGSALIPFLPKLKSDTPKNEDQKFWIRFGIRITGRYPYKTYFKYGDQRKQLQYIEDKIRNEFRNLVLNYDSKLFSRA